MADGRCSAASSDATRRTCGRAPRAAANDRDCVVALIRAEHRAFDQGRLDVLPAMIANGCWDELVHLVRVHHVDPISLLHRLTGERWIPRGAHTPGRAARIAAVKDHDHDSCPPEPAIDEITLTITASASPDKRSLVLLSSSATLEPETATRIRVRLTDVVPHADVAPQPDHARRA